MTEGTVFLFTFFAGVASGMSVMATFRWLLGWADDEAGAAEDMWAA